MIPSSTYRIQFSSATTLQQGAELVPYLDALGVGAVYASPLLASGKGSNHGYDVVDPTRACGARGGEEGRRALVAAARARGMGFLLDIVPNHVGVDDAKANPWWWDVLTHGRGSRYASYFDIDWAAGPILLPVLGAEPDPDDEEKVTRPRSRSPTTAPSCATTSTPSRSHRAPRTVATARGQVRPRCTPASTTASPRGSAAQRS